MTLGPDVAGNQDLHARVEARDGMGDVGGLAGLEAGDVRRGMLVAAIVALLAGGCDLVTTPEVSGGPGCRKLVRQGAADYVNFVKLNGVTYTADRPVVGRLPGRGKPAVPGAWLPADLPAGGPPGWPAGDLRG
jgi:hypothetical protein